MSQRAIPPTTLRGRMQSNNVAKVLLIDDEPANLLALEVVLEDIGAQLVSARSGEEGVQKAEKEDFAVILLDVQMPGMNGYEAAGQLRSHPRSQFTPIIFLTAFDDDTDSQRRGYTLGAVDFLVKPLNSLALRAKVQVFLELFNKTERVKELERAQFQQRLAEEKRRWEQTGYLVNRIFAELTSEEQALRKVLQTICEQLHSDAGGLWIVDNRNLLRCAHFWQLPERSAPKLEAVSREASFGMGIGLPGRVWAEQAAIWVEHLAQEPNFPRLVVAEQEGISTAFAFPIALGPEFLGVVELFSRTRHAPDPDLLDLLANIGRQIGPFLQRIRAERALAESEARKSAILDAALDCVVTIDEHDRVIEWNPAAERTFGYAQTDAIGKRIGDLIVPPSFREAHYQGMAHYLATGEGPVLGRLIELPAVRADGSEIQVELAITPIHVGANTFFTSYLRDITSRKANEAAIAGLNKDLQRRLSEFETLLDVIPVGIGIATDRECSDIRVNPAFAKVLGVKPADNGSKTALSEQRPTNFRCFNDAGQEIPHEQLPMQVAAREGREVRDAELDIVHEDGTVVRLLEYAAPLFDESGEPRGCVGAFVDITERKKAASRHRFLVQLDDAVRPLIDPNEITATYAKSLGEYLSVDRCAYAEVEADQDTFEVVGNYNRGVPTIVGQYTFTQFGAEVLRLMRENRPYVVSDIDAYALAPADVAAYRHTMIQAVICVPLHKAGKFVAAMAVHQKTPRTWTGDEVEIVLTIANRCWESIERARVTRDLQQSEAKFRQLANTIPQLAWMANADGWIFWYNDRWYEYTGSTPEQMQGWGWQQVHDPGELARVTEKWKSALAEGRPWEDTFPLRRHDGHFRWHLSRALPLRDEHGRIVFWFGTNTDITDQRELVREREQLLETERGARAAAERAGRMKDEFLATLSHELRTPLNAILGYASLIQMANMEGGELKSAVAVIERNAKLQARLIEDLLEMNRIVSGKIRLELQRLNLAEAVEAAVTTVAPSAIAKGVSLQKFIDPLARPVRGDPARIQQIVCNLLSNAIKFTPAGGSVQLAVEGGESSAVITVTDTGQGIAPDFLPHVFDPFRQADGSTTRAYGGLGLGLAIVRNLVDLHGGAVRASSQGIGHGSMFMVTLPVLKADGREEAVELDHAPALDERPSASGAELKGIRVLVVDDEPDATEFVKRLLEGRQAEVEKAYSAKEAFELLNQSYFDLLVSDIGMPHEDGYELLRKVRAMTDSRRTIPAVALTAFAGVEDRQRAALAGFQMHISKPVDAAELIAVVANLTGRAGADKS